MDYEAFLADLKTQDAVVRNLEIIGEATKNLSEEIRQQYANIPWRSMAGVRARLIHHILGSTWTWFGRSLLPNWTKWP